MTGRAPPVEVLASTIRFRGRVFDVATETVRLPSGLRQELAIVRHPGAVCVAAVDDRARLLLVRQYRHAVGAWTLEIPAGRLEVGEDPLAAARRELEEETGHRARAWRELRRFYAAPGFCSEELTLFLAEDLEEVPGGGLPCDADEEIELVRRTPAELLDGDCRDAKSLIAAAAVTALRCAPET
jgi:ADP-ribose pyrophosphatase